MKRQTFTQIIVSLTLFLSVQNSLLGLESSSYPTTVPRQGISQEAWDEVFPYLLPDDMQIKQKLDEIFGETRVILNSETLSQAGFTNSKPREWSRIVVTKHRDLPGYVFKIYLDDQRHKSDATARYFSVKRVEGALAIQNFIEEHELQHLFKVPKKWIYLLPETPMPKKKYSYKHFILVEEDMYILDKDANKRAWKSSQVTEETLFGLYRILDEIGLLDCTKIDNIPFSEDGKITFIDTETFGVDRIPFKRLRRSLSHKMRSFWTDLISSH